MATVKYFLDTRRSGNESPSVVKLAIRHKNTTAFISTGIKVLKSQWDSKLGKVMEHPMKNPLNARLNKFKSEVELALYDILSEVSSNSLNASMLRKKILEIINPEQFIDDKTFLTQFDKFIALKSNNRTRELYQTTLSRIRAFDNNVNHLQMEDVTVEWLSKFEKFLEKTAPSKNARNIHLRNIRAVFNYAINNEVTSHYPFRKFKIKGVATPKRSLSVEELRQLFSVSPESHAQKYLDAFKLIFFLCGINTIDLCNLTSVVSGRIEYYRAKTHRFYSIKVEPEALEIIEKYRGEKHLLNYLDTYKSYKDFAKYINKYLKLIGVVKRVGKGEKKEYQPLFPLLSTYWARHSWATIAASLDIPKETIAAALGHGGNTVTDIYISFDQNKIDEANRRVMDWVLYGKK